MKIELGPVDAVQSADVDSNDIRRRDLLHLAALEEERDPTTVQSTKLVLLELLIQHGVAKLTAHADGSDDEGELNDILCFTEPSEGQFESCEIPAGVEDMVHEILNASGVNFNGDGGFFNLTITTATRECEIECGWYYTASDSRTTTETL